MGDWSTAPHERTFWSEIADRAHQLEFPIIAGTRTRVLLTGSGPKTIVMMAGTSGHLEAFTHNIRALSAEYSVIAYDYPGHGYSTLADGSPLEIPAYVEHLMALVQHYQLDRPHLLGESLGGWIAIKAALQHPEAFGSLVLSAPGGRMVGKRKVGGAQSASADAVAEPSWQNVKRRLGVVIHDDRLISDELVGLRQAIYAQDGFRDSMDSIRALQDVEIRRRNSVTDDDYRGIPVPALLVWTDHEPSGDADEGKRLADLIPRGDFLLVENAAHWPQWEDPASFNQKTLEFLRKVDR